MTILKKNALCIEIQQSSPEEYLQWIRQALADVIRWRAFMDASDTIMRDRDSLIVIADLISELSDVKMS